MCAALHGNIVIKVLDAYYKEKDSIMNALCGNAKLNLPVCVNSGKAEDKDGLDSKLPRL